MHNTFIRQALRLCSGLVPAALVCAIPAVLIILDIAVFKLTCNEAGIVEIAQAVCALLTAILMGIAAWRCPDFRGGLMLVCALFVDIVLRENDGWFDNISHGCWIYPVIVVTAIAAYIAWRNWRTVMPALMHIRENHHFPALTIGFFITIGFARIFGMKPIWKTVVGVDDFRPAKHVAEEGVEFLGYALMLYWAICYFRDIVISLKRKA